MFKLDSKEYSIKDLPNVMIRMNNYMRTHCWSCECELVDMNQLFQLPYNEGIFCSECFKRLTSSLVLDSKDVEIVNVDDKETE